MKNFRIEEKETSYRIQKRKFLFLWDTINIDNSWDQALNTLREYVEKNKKPNYYYFDSKNLGKITKK